MFDLKTILAVNALGNGSYHALAVRVDLSRRVWQPIAGFRSRLRGTHAAKAFNRRVALYARDTGVSVRFARALLQFKDQEQRIGSAA